LRIYSSNAERKSVYFLSQSFKKTKKTTIATALPPKLKKPKKQQSRQISFWSIYCVHSCYAGYFRKYGISISESKGKK